MIKELDFLRLFNVSFCVRLLTDLRSGVYGYDPLSENFTDQCLHFTNPKASFTARKQGKAAHDGFEIKFVTDEIEVYGLGNDNIFSAIKPAYFFL